MLLNFLLQILTRMGKSGIMMSHFIYSLSHFPFHLKVCNKIYVVEAETIDKHINKHNLVRKHLL